MRNVIVLVAAGSLLVGAAAVSGCASHHRTERAGRQVDKGIDSVDRKTDRALEKTGDAVEDAGDAIEDKTDELDD